MYYEKSSVAEKCVAMYYEMDYDLFQANNSNIQETMDWMSAAFNNMQTLFENDDIRVSLYHVFIWESIDPYEGTGSSSSHLTAFYNNRPSIPGNMAQLVGLDGPLGGVTRQFALPCNGLGRSYASVDFDFQTVPTYSWNLNVMTHENGHAMGSRHTHACVWNGNGTAIDGCGPAAGYSEGCDGPIPPEGGTIMSYCHLNPVGMNFLLGFGPQPKTVIINNINAASCLSTDCNVCFDTMSDSSINVEEITKTSAKLSWKDPGKDAELWEYIVRKAQRSDPTGWIQTSTDKINLNNLEKNTYYEIFVRKICGGIGMASRHYMFATDGDFCNGDIFTDSGGVDKPFVPGDFIRTISPGNTGQKIKVNFSRLLLHPSYDHLYVYDGKDISAPQLADLTGIHEQANYSYTSTDLSGALTFRFVTKDTNPELDGWIANVECLENLATEDFDKYLDFSYYPNPILNQLNVNAKNEILEATVYNIEGRKLHSKKIKSKTTQLDFSKYPAGNYIVELKFKEKPVTLKVIKK